LRVEEAKAKEIDALREQMVDQQVHIRNLQQAVKDFHAMLEREKRIRQLASLVYFLDYAGHGLVYAGTSGLNV